MHPSLSSAQLRVPGPFSQEKNAPRPASDFMVRNGILKSRKEIKSEYECTVVIGPKCTLVINLFNIAEALSKSFSKQSTGESCEVRSDGWKYANLGLLFWSAMPRLNHLNRTRGDGEELSLQNVKFFEKSIDTIIAREYSGILTFGYALMDKRRSHDLGLGTACSPPPGASSPRTVTQILTRPFILHAGDAGKDEK